MRRFSRWAALGALLGLAFATWGYAQDTDSAGGNVTALVSETVVVAVTAGPVNFTAISEADITAGTLSNAGAFTIRVDAITNFTVDAQLTAIATDSAEGGIVAPGTASLLLGASASGAGGTSAVADTAFSGAVPATISLNSAFSQVNNANGTGESSTIDLTLDMDQLGNRDQGETLTYTLSFVVTET